MKTGSKIAALALPLGAMLALAQPAAAADGAATSAAARETSREAAPAKRAEPKRYCLNIVPDTGTRMSKRMCKTSKEWSDEGVEVTSRR